MGIGGSLVLPAPGAKQGQLLRVDQDKDDYKVLPNRTVTVVFTDPNGKEVARQTRQANDFGSISGSFTAPRDRLAGGYTIAINTGPRGSTGFNVEEYKRPKFQVTVAAPAVAPKLNGDVAMTGKAEAYTGAAIDGAEVKWHVVREEKNPERGTAKLAGTSNHVGLLQQQTVKPQPEIHMYAGERHGLRHHAPASPRNAIPIVPSLDSTTCPDPDAAEFVVGTAFPPDSSDVNGICRFQLFENTIWPRISPEGSRAP